MGRQAEQSLVYFRLMEIPKDHPPFVFFRTEEAARASYADGVRENPKMAEHLKLVRVRVEFLPLEEPSDWLLWGVLGPGTPEPEILVDSAGSAAWAVAQMRKSMPEVAAGFRYLPIRARVHYES